MTFDAVVLGAGQRTRLVPDRVGDRGRTQLVDQRCAAQPPDLTLVQADVRRGIGCQLRTTAAVPGHVGRLQVDEVRDHQQRVVELGTVEDPVRMRLQVENGVPRLQLAELLEPGGRVRLEHSDDRWVVRAAGSLTRHLERLCWREESGVRLHVMAEVHDAHRVRDRFAFSTRWEAGAVPPLAGEAQGVSYAVTEIEATYEHV